MSEIIKRQNNQIIGMSLAELENLSEEFDQSRFRGKQLFNSVYKQQTDSFSNIKTLPIISVSYTHLTLPTILLV